MDHFNGFDQLLRVSLGREKEITLHGPPGFIARVQHKLAAYTWNLVQRYVENLTLVVREVHPGGQLRTARFSCRTAFTPQPKTPLRVQDSIVFEDQTICVRTACLDHGIPCFAYSIEEKMRINVLKSGIEAMGFRVGPWLRDLKRAILRGEPADFPIRVWWLECGTVREECAHLESCGKT